MMSPDQRTLLARFTWADRARQAMERLRAHGLTTVSVDRLDARDDVPENPVAEPWVDWGRLGYTPERLDDKWTSASAWDNGLGLISGEGVLLTAVVPADREDEARRLIQEAGGVL
jgi:hypothetical protein